MNIFEFIPSQDVAAYCAEIKHEFNPIERAWLIEQSDRSIPEKDKCFQELIDHYPDMSFHESVQFRVKTGLHDYLRALIEWNERTSLLFFNTGNKRSLSYSLSAYDIGELGLGDQIDPLRDFMKKHKKYKSFDSIDELWADVCPHWDRVKSHRRIRVFVQDKETKGDLFQADLDRAGEIICLQEDSLMKRKEHPGDLCYLFVSIPVPFQIGDFVCHVRHPEEPYVLRSLPECKKTSLEALSGAYASHYVQMADTPTYATVYYLTQSGDIAQSFPDLPPRSPFAQGWGFDLKDLQYYRGDNIHDKLLDFAADLKKSRP